MVLRPDIIALEGIRKIRALLSKQQAENSLPAPAAEPGRKSSPAPAIEQEAAPEPTAQAAPEAGDKAVPEAEDITAPEPARPPRAKPVPKPKPRAVPTARVKQEPRPPPPPAPASPQVLTENGGRSKRACKGFSVGELTSAGFSHEEIQHYQPRFDRRRKTEYADNVAALVEFKKQCNTWQVAYNKWRAQPWPGKG